MANLFEKPIAARPMSEFVALPLDFIDRSIQRKQQLYDTAKADIALTEDELLKSRATQLDRPRQQEILQGYYQDIDDIVEGVGGDYSRVQGQLDVLKRRMTRDMRGGGELGAINATYMMAGQHKTEMDKRYGAGNIGDAGMSLADKSISGARTTLRDDGSWSTFQGYIPSNITDVGKVLSNKVDEINAKYTAEGNKYLSANDISINLMNSMAGDIGIQRAMQENYAASGSTDTFENYQAGMLAGIINDKVYQETDKAVAAAARKKAAGGGDTLMIGDRFTMPTEGIESTMRGGSVPWLKGVGNRLFGSNNFKEFNEWRNSGDVSERIAAIEGKTGETAPTAAEDLIPWIEEKYKQAYNQPVKFVPITDDNVLARYINKQSGVLKGSGRIFDVEGNVVSSEEFHARSIKSKDNPNPGQAIGIVDANSGYPAGSIMLQDSSGAKYIQEPSDAGILQTDDYATSLIRSASMSPDNRRMINLPSSTWIESDGGRKMFLKQGRYQSISNGDGTYNVIDPNTKEVIGVLESNGEFKQKPGYNED